jgi:hypothetical protein
LLYLRSEFAEEENTCNECPSTHRDEEGYCGVCRFRKIEARFPVDFRLWFDNLARLYQWRKAGYSLDSEGLGFQDWQALATITRFYEVKDIEAQIPRAPD